MAGLRDNRRWEVLGSDPEAEGLLSGACGIPPLVARVMVARGIRTPEAARAFLTPSLERDWADPLDIPGMAAAVDRVLLALDRHERIAIFGDFDVDGMSSTCLLTLALRHFGADVTPFIPHRFGEGYGLSVEALKRVMGKCHPDLIITVDNGIAAKEEVAAPRQQGVDVVVTDHHEPGDLVPEGVPVTDPKMDRDNYSRELAGAGVALKLVCELGRRLGEPDLWRGYTEVATLGTISDMMLLQGENRALVTDGIEHMRATQRPGIVALAATAGVDLATITADDLPFTLIPRLNAAGRMGTTDVAFDLLLTDDPAEAAVLAGRLEQTNAERREIESVLTDEAMAKLDATYTGGRVIVVGGEGWHEGVKGIVASRIVNKYHVPAILFTISDGVARGSGRSVGSVDLFHAVEQCSDLLVRFGGHAGAVGVTCDAANLDAFRSRLEEVMDELPGEQFEDRGEVAALVGLGELTRENIDALEALQPFGQGNKKPLLGTTGVLMRNRSRVGSGRTHLRFLATDGLSTVPAIMFRTPDIERAAGYDGAVDLVFDAVNETWQDRTKPKLMVKDILYRDAPAAQVQADSLTDDLFSRTDEILSHDEYSGIAEAKTFFTKAVGVTFEGRQEVLTQLCVGDVLSVVHEADNQFDPNALALMTAHAHQVGFLRRQIASALAPLIDAGATYVANVREVTGGDGRHSLGVNVQIVRTDEPARPGGTPSVEPNDRRADLARYSYDELTDHLKTEMIGSHDLLSAQRAALQKLAQGHSTLCVMATGRGKSLIFHIHAAREAIVRGRASVFVYPLRALVADQAFHLQEEFGQLGMQVRVLTGETSLDERDDTFSALASGAVDVLLTTPEFLVIHADRFAQARRVGFLVVDEAHHAGMARSGKRGAYTSLPEVLATLGNPTALAVTATAAAPVAREICRLLSISANDVVVDQSVRKNLSVVDCRELRDREAAVVSIVATGQKTVVYVNSREQSVTLARMLRHSLPDLGQKIAFYNAGLSRTDRSRVEKAFRSGALCCIVSTSAFGEGVNLPDIRNVILYHMPFGAVEFNQMSGRAGRDGKPATVYLLFGSRDSRINQRILASAAPSRCDLVTLYRALTWLARSSEAQGGDGSFCLSNADIVRCALTIDQCTELDEHSVSCGVSIFKELGFLTTRGYGTARRITMVASPQRMELDRSIRYLEGIRSREEFVAFCDWALSSRPQEMLDRINRPIVPAFGTVVDK